MKPNIGNLLSRNLGRMFESRKITSALHAEIVLGVPKSTVDRAWHNRTSSRLDTVQDLATSLHIQTWQLLVPELDPSSLPKLTHTSQPIRPLPVGVGEAIELLGLFEQLDQKSRHTVVDSIRLAIAEETGLTSLPIT